MSVMSELRDEFNSYVISEAEKGIVPMVYQTWIERKYEQQAERIKALEAQIDMRKIATALHEQQARSMAERLKEKNALIASKDGVINLCKLIFGTLNNHGGFGYWAHEQFDKALAAIERHQKGEK